MNHKIKELAEQAGVLADFSEDIKVGRYSIGGTNQSMEKFVELIVRECAQFVEDKFDFIGDEIIVKEKMLEHFGIKE